MQRLGTFARGSRVLADLLNALQDRIVGLRKASNADGSALALAGRDGLYWTTVTAGVADGASVVIDASRDWRGHHVQAVLVRLPAAAQRLHGADAWRRNDPSVTKVVRTVWDAFTGTGCPVSAGVPTIDATHFGIVLDELSPSADRVWLFADSENDGRLTLYNDSGATLHAELFFGGSSASAASAAAPGVPSRLAGTATTTDATWTTVAGCTSTPAASTGVVYAARVSAIRSDGTEAGGWDLSWRARRGSSGAPVVGTAVFALAEVDDADLDVRAQASGDDVVLQVHGDAAKTFHWRAEIDATEARLP